MIACSSDLITLCFWGGIVATDSSRDLENYVIRN